MKSSAINVKRNLNKMNIHLEYINEISKTIGNPKFDSITEVSDSDVSDNEVAINEAPIVNSCVICLMERNSTYVFLPC